jgi:hypothetical protein
VNSNSDWNAIEFERTFEVWYMVYYHKIEDRYEEKALSYLEYSGNLRVQWRGQVHQ